MYKTNEWNKAGLDFQRTFRISIKPFYDGLLTYVFKSIQIDPFKFDEYLHKIHGEYESDGKSILDIILEKYGESGLNVFNALMPSMEVQDKTVLEREEVRC